MPEKKSWIEIILMPVVVACVGSLGTYLITQQQEANAVAKAASDRQIKILEIFAEKITDEDMNQRILGINLLRALDADLAEKLALAVADAEPDKSELKIAATRIADEAKASIERIPRIYLHVDGSPEKTAATEVEKLLESQGWVVPGIERMGSKLPRSSQLRYFKASEKEPAEKIHKVLADAGYDMSLNYINGYEESESIRPMHFEIWFASGRPLNK